MAFPCREKQNVPVRDALFYESEYTTFVYDVKRNFANSQEFLLLSCFQ